MSKERPILFSAPMVRALLDTSKSQTRRIVKLPQENPLGEWEPTTIGGEDGGRTATGATIPAQGAIWHTRTGECLASPYGQPSDRLRVRETFIAYGRWETRCNAKKARDEWHFVDMTVDCDRRYQYAADNPDVPLAKGRGGALPGWYTRPAIFMPGAVSRILLEIVSVRVERLNDCSDADAVAEGIGLTPAAIGMKLTFPPGESMPVAMYRALWESINGVGSWAANPWVWAITFRRVQP
jgi:hypothetical protein